jgi:hypothetical protein
LYFRSFSCSTADAPTLQSLVVRLAGRRVISDLSTGALGQRVR